MHVKEECQCFFHVGCQLVLLEAGIILDIICKGGEDGGWKLTIYFSGSLLATKPKPRNLKENTP